MQFFAHDIRGPGAIRGVVGRRLFPGFTRSNDPIFFLLSVHIGKLQPFMGLARNWQNLVRPNLRVIPGVNISRYLPVLGLMRGHFVGQLLFERLDLCLELVFSERFRHVWKERIYSIIIPKRVEYLFMDAATARRFII